MAAHKTNPFLKWSFMAVGGLLVVLFLLKVVHSGTKPESANATNTAEKSVKNTASKDSAKESLDTLTAELNDTQKKINSVVTNNETLQKQKDMLQSQLQSKETQSTVELSRQVDQLKAQLQSINNRPVASNDYKISNGDTAQPITTVPELSTVLDPKSAARNSRFAADTSTIAPAASVKPKAIPYYTIPANATAVEDRLMTALVGRIPVKGVVVDPYPFKIVFSNNTLAANGLRVPNLKQMIVSGYTEGDLNLSSVRGWVTSLTFVFNDGTISTTTSNQNNIGKFTKDDALGYLSDAQGNPFIRGKLITNAPTFVGVNVLLGAAQGAASAYAQSQTTTQSTIVGTNTSSVTGSPGAYVAGQAAGNAAAQVQQWWHDREEQSFDAVYVPTVYETIEPQTQQKVASPVYIAVNFAKEIKIDYDPQGRKIVYTHSRAPGVTANLD